MRIYEELFIVRPDAPEEEIDGLVGQLQGVIADAGGTVDKVDKWGVRKLAYRVKKRQEGFYVLVQFHSDANLVREIERRLRVSDLVLKFQTVRLDLTLKWMEKRKKVRDKRAARRPAPQAAPPGAPAPAPGAPAAPAAPATPVDHPAPGAPPAAQEG